MNIKKMLNYLPIALICVGLSIAAPTGLSWLEYYQALNVAASTQPISTNSPAPVNVTKKDVIQGVPRRISVPDLGIDVSVVDGYYNAKTGAWTLTEDTAFFAIITDLPNSLKGNTFIYGHNGQKIFGKLLQIKTDAKVIITTDNNYQFTYKYIKTEAVKPTEVDVLNYSGKPRLTLQTCSGIWAQTRQMFYFTLTGYKKL